MLSHLKRRFGVLAAVAVMAGTQAVNIINRRELQNAEDEETERTKLISEYQERLEHPFIAAAKGYIDDVIDPEIRELKFHAV